jgi:hypothetical protein
MDSIKKLEELLFLLHFFSKKWILLFRAYMVKLFSKKNV